MNTVIRRPKYVNHVIKPLIVRLDSAAFLFRNGTNDPLYAISDRYSPFGVGEQPEAVISLIKEGNRDLQLRLAVRGRYHVERLSYYTKDPRLWAEWGWLIFSQPEIARIRQYLALINPDTGLWELM